MMCNLQRISKSFKKKLTESTNFGLLWGVCEMCVRADPAPHLVCPLQQLSEMALRLAWATEELALW